MKYTVDVDVAEKKVFKQAHFFIPEEVYRHFVEVTKNRGAKMSPIIVDFMRNFVSEYHRKNQPKQHEMF